MTDLISRVARAADHEIVETSWGRLVWMVSGKLGNSATMTVGCCHIDPGMANPRHYHPNCDEVLHILQGTIEHSFDDQTVRMTAGDTISIPAGVVHNARNIGDDQAVFLIAFSSADRQVINES
jgi:quercetin dioxygenase-like cupin family protein